MFILRDNNAKLIFILGLDFLGMPHFVASGIHDKQSNLSKVKGRGRAKPKESLKYRFLVIPRFGTDLQVMINKYISFSVKTTYTIAIKVIDILEYIHSHGYTHGDIKGSNLLLSRQEELKRIKSKKTPFSKVYVVDFGLVERYVYKDDGVHKKYEEDARRANNGTVEFMSRDGHIGAFSRRGDLEILGFNMLSWLSGGKLPWMSDLKNLDFVRDSKNYYMEKLDELLNYCFSEYTNGNPEASAVVKSSLKKKSRINGKIDKVKLFAGPPGIVDYLSYVAQLDFEEEPDYEHLKNLLVDAITESGAKYDEKFTFDDKDIATNGENGSTITPPSTIVKKSAKRRKSPSPTRPATPTKAASRKRKSPSVSSLSSPQKRSPRKTKSPTRPVVTRKRKS